MALSERNFRIKLTVIVLAIFFSLSVFASSSSSHASPVLLGRRGSTLRLLSGCRKRSQKMAPGCEFQVRMQGFQIPAKRRHLAPPSPPVRDWAGHYFIRVSPPLNSPPPPQAMTQKDPRTELSKYAPSPPPQC